MVLTFDVAAFMLSHIRVTLFKEHAEGSAAVDRRPVILLTVS